MITSLFYLKKNGDRLATFPFSLKGNGGGWPPRFSIERGRVMGGPPLRSKGQRGLVWDGHLSFVLKVEGGVGMAISPFYLKRKGNHDEMAISILSKGKGGGDGPPFHSI